MPTETIRFTVAGSNPLQQSIQLTVDANGNAVGNFSYPGANVGVDTVQAFMDSHSLSSNQAQVTWQNGNGLISLTGVTSTLYAGSSSALLPPTPGAAITTQQFNSLMFNTHPQSLLSGDPHQSGNQASPIVNNAITYSGIYSGDVPLNGDNGGPILLSLVGTFVVTQAGQITFTAYQNQGCVIGVQGASFVGGVNSPGGVTRTPVKGYTVIAGRNGNWPGGNYAQDNFVLNFPAPGVYPFEIYFASGAFQERQFCLLANGQVIRPVTAVTAPPAPAPGTGSLILSPNASGPNLVGTSQSFTLQVSGIKYTTVSCLPLLEGKSGSIVVANTPNSHTFLLPTLPNGETLTPAQVVANLFALSGDNGSWNNRLSIAYSGSGGIYNLVYNGAAVDPNIATTELTVTTRDLAYYASPSAYDLFKSTSQGGGSSAQLQVNWQVQPAIASVMPTTLKAGGSYKVTFNLAKPLPPIQKNIAAVFTGGGGLQVVNQTTNYNSSGFITGWTVSVTTPTVQGTSARASISLTATGAITYLSGTAFVTETLTYISNLSTAITLTP